MRRRLPLVLAAGMVAALAGCGPASSGAAAAAPAWLHASLSFKPNPPVARRYEAVDLTLTSPGGRPLPASKVTMTVGMPDMYMPDQNAVIRLHGSGRGRFTGRVLLVMGGQWVARVHVVDGQRSADLSLPFEVRD